MNSRPEGDGVLADEQFELILKTEDVNPAERRCGILLFEPQDE